jgi:hypothetical protein
MTTKQVLVALLVVIVVASVASTTVLYRQNLHLQAQLRAAESAQDKTGALCETAWRHLLDVQSLVLELEGHLSDLFQACRDEKWVNADDAESLLLDVKAAALKIRSCEFGELEKEP